MILLLLLIATLVPAMAMSQDTDKRLDIESLTKRATFSQSRLRQSGSEDILMDYNRAYPGEVRHYQSIKLCKLLESFHISPSSTLEFIASDNFSVLIPAHYVTSCEKNQSIAYLAIEPESKWPILFNHTDTTAGPFAIIWTEPKLSYISDEYWAWSVTKILEHQAIDEKTVISAPKDLSTSHGNAKILNGYRVYVSHCSSCHSVNHIGKGSIGPDLNQPKNPLDYYTDVKVLKQFIRDPSSVRKLPKGRMSGSSLVGLNDSDLGDLIEYFAYIKYH